MTSTDEPTDARQFWDERYAESPQIWSGRVNTALEVAASGLPAGTALDLGCGEGGDSIWLAEQGWTVTGADISETALERAREAATAREVSDTTTWQQVDLAHDFPAGQFNLVSACFLASPVHMPRATILQRAADAVADGGTLLVVSHHAPPPWARHAHGPADFPSPAQELDTLALDPSQWDITAEARTRETTGPDGESVTLDDTVVIARRR